MAKVKLKQHFSVEKLSEELIVTSSMQAHWQTIMQLTTNILSMPIVMILKCQGTRLSVVSHTQSQEEAEFYGQQPVHHHVLRTHQSLWIEGQDHHHAHQLGHGLSHIKTYIGLPLFLPDGRLFGLYVLMAPYRHRLSDTEFDLLTHFQATIESQLANQCQQNEITYLYQQFDTERENLSPQNDFVQAQKFRDSGTGFLNHNAIDKLISSPPSTHQEAIIYIGFDNAQLIQTRFNYQQWSNVLTSYYEAVHPSSHSHVIPVRNNMDLALIVHAPHIEEEVQLLCHQLLHMKHTSRSSAHGPVHIHTCIGVSGITNHIDINERFNQALTAMLTCQSEEKALLHYSETQTETHARRYDMETYLLQAIHDDELHLHYQPKVDLVTKKWLGAEALLRWGEDNTQYQISIETLIHLAEQNGVIDDIGHFVLREAIRTASDWIKDVPHFKIAINISTRQLLNPKLLPQIQTYLTQYNLPAEALELEITESRLMPNKLVAKEILQSLRDLGITVSLDDFGTGYASFDYLKKYPFDHIKVDKSFLNMEDENDKNIVRSIIQLAQQLKMQVTVEGIETPEQEDFVIQAGGNIAQGYLYAHPMPAHQFSTLLKRMH